MRKLSAGIPMSIFILIFISISSVEAKEIEKRNAFNSVRQGDTFYSSSRDNVSIGPKIRYPNRQKEFNSSSERTFTGGQINNIPFSSPAEALEVIPGLAVGN